MSIDGRSRQQGDSQSTFVREARAAVREAGRDRVPLNEFTFKSAGGCYSFFGLAVSDAFLRLGLAGVAVDDLPIPDEDIEVFDENAERRDWAVRELRRMVIARDFRSRAPIRAEMPKKDYAGGIAPLELIADWMDDRLGSTTGTRTLSIPDPLLRAMARAMAILLTDYIDAQGWVYDVGGRPGVSRFQIFASLRQAVRHTEREWLLMADVSKFFDSVLVTRALNFVDAKTRYQRDFHLRDYLPMLLGHPTCRQKGLPQGNPLSVLPANLYGRQAIDKLCRQYGPHLRFIDDLLTVVPSRAAGQKLFDELARHCDGFNLRLHPRKSVLHHIPSGSTWRMDGSPVDEAPVYLGAQLVFEDGDLTFHLPDSAIRRMADDLRTVWARPIPQRMRQDGGITEFAQRLERVRWAFRGWMEAFGGLVWTEEQEEAVETVMELAGLTPTGLRRLAQEWDLVPPEWDEAPHTRRRLLQPLAHACGHVGRFDIDVEVGPQDFKDLAIMASLDVQRDQYRREFAEALEQPVDIPYGPGRVVHHTAKHGLKRWGTRGMLTPESSDAMPLPAADLRLRSDPHIKGNQHHFGGLAALDEPAEDD